MKNVFSFRLNGRKSIYFCGESSYVSVLFLLFLMLRANVSSLLPKYKQESRPRTIWQLVAFVSVN